MAGSRSRIRRMLSVQGSGEGWTSISLPGLGQLASKLVHFHALACELVAFVTILVGQAMHILDPVPGVSATWFKKCNACWYSCEADGLQLRFLAGGLFGLEALFCFSMSGF